MNWTINDLTLAIEFAKKRGGDCTLLVLYVASQILNSENADMEARRDEARNQTGS